MDCSGFTKTVYYMNGFIIPRDASQQILAGKDVDPELRFDNLKKGDLMFFGKKATDSTRQRVTHVGIWLGNGKGEFIHASGRVKIGSIDEGSERYDPFNKGRYLGSRRYLGEKDPNISPLPFKS
jgi:cell wall-associated NlpC family hydrolase